jgi:hypothetical protein
LFLDGHLIAIIKAARRISVISCLPALGPFLKDRLGLDDVMQYLIPAEQGSKAKLGVDSGSGVHYPDTFQKLQTELTGRHAGRLFLVAAGILGKFYCETIKTYGGIALDVGSLVDGWLGKATRPGYDHRLQL